MFSWSQLNKLSFNLSKMVMLHFPNTIANIIEAIYYLNGPSIKSVTAYKDLGVVVSSDLSWSEHCEIIISRAYRQLCLICRTFNVVC